MGAPRTIDWSKGLKANGAVTARRLGAARPQGALLFGTFGYSAVRTVGRR
jgi:hypothetical protein